MPARLSYISVSTNGVHGIFAIRAGVVRTFFYTKANSGQEKYALSVPASLSASTNDPEAIRTSPALSKPQFKGWIAFVEGSTEEFILLGSAKFSDEQIDLVENETAQLAAGCRDAQRLQCRMVRPSRWPTMAVCRILDKGVNVVPLALRVVK